MCLEVGEYTIGQPLSIQGATSLRLVGKGVASRLESTGRILTIGGGHNIVLESFAMLSRPAAQTPDAVLIIQSSQDVSVERLRIQIENNNPAWAAVGLSGALIDLSLMRTHLSGPSESEAQTRRAVRPA